jgi:hypothetical protein
LLAISTPTLLEIPTHTLLEISTPTLLKIPAHTLFETPIHTAPTPQTQLSATCKFCLKILGLIQGQGLVYMVKDQIETLISLCANKPRVFKPKYVILQWAYEI